MKCNNDIIIIKQRDQYQIKCITSLYKEEGGSMYFWMGSLIKAFRRKVHVREDFEIFPYFYQFLEIIYLINNYYMSTPFQASDGDAKKN